MKTRITPLHRIMRLNSLILVGVFVIVAAVVAVPVYSGRSDSLTAGRSAHARIPAQEIAAVNSSKSLATSNFTAWFSTFQPLSPLPQSPSVTVATFAANCATAQTVFHPNDTVCAHVTGATPGWQLVWQNANFDAVQTNDISSATQDITFTLSANPSLGDWHVIVYDQIGGNVEASSTFTVSDPLNPLVDVQVNKSPKSNQTSAGSQVMFSIQVGNGGPDTATNVQLTDAVPANTTFVSFSQLTGPAFTCTNPSAGGTGNTVCAINSLNKGDTAVFLGTYSVSGGVSAGDTISNTASVSNTVPDSNSGNDISTASVAVVSNTCSLTCPANITTTANTTENGQHGAHVGYDDPVPSGNCGTVTSTPASGSFFPVGTTTVNATSDTGGGSCSFTVTVNDASGLPDITCPANKTATADSNCQATVDPGTATSSNGTVSGSRSDELNLSDPYPKGVTTITWTATNSAGSASCQQTVTVTDNTPPTISCPANITTNTDPGQCSATVDPGTATATDNCDTPTVTGRRSDNQPLNAPYPKGTTTITWTATDSSGNSSSCTQTVTVNDNEAPRINCPANVTRGTDPGTCSATFNPGTAEATDNCGSPTVTGVRSDGQPLTAPYPKGTTVIVWIATDSSGNSSTPCAQTITVNDTEAPKITTNGLTPVMWPPNHNYHTFQVTDFVTGVSDNCDTLSVSNVVIAKVTSDEAENGPSSGNTLNDIVIASDCKSVQLRAEREGAGDGRVYTITFKISDTSGNVGTTTANVVVPKNLGVPVVDSGPHYTVTSNCP